MSDYQHKSIHSAAINLPVGKVVCIGQNYHDHIAEMKSKTAPEALFFIKPATALCSLAPEFVIPEGKGAVHNETEIAVLIQQRLSYASEHDVKQAIWGYSLALDLTLRDIQAQLKQLGRPWEIAKGFDGACPVAEFIPAAEFTDTDNISFSLKINGQYQQQGNSKDMIRGILQTISEMSQHFTLMPGDIVLTGTPAGVGPLHAGDKLELTMGSLSVTTQVAS